MEEWFCKHLWLVALIFTPVSLIWGSQTVHKICMPQCVDVVFSPGETLSYYDCMQKCFASSEGAWIMASEVDGRCGVLPPVDSDSETPCATLNIATKSEMHNVSDVFSDKWAVREFLAVIWTPCPFGMRDVGGYEIELMEVGRIGICYYKQLSLTRSLSRDDQTKEFSVLFHHQELDYERDYKVSIGGLPKTERNFGISVMHRAKSCTDLNGVGNCVCGLDGLDQAPPINITVNGYHVNVVVPALRKCFHIIKYRLQLLSVTEMNKTTVLEKFDFVSSNGLMHRIFYPVYHPSDSSSLALVYIAYDPNGKIVYSKPAPLDIADWKPSTPSLLPGRGELNAGWNCAPEFYNITKYHIQLNWYGLNPTHGIRHKTIYKYSDGVGSLMGHKMTFKLLSVRPGIYTVQVREWRSPSYPISNWSMESQKVKVEAFHLKAYLNKGSMIIAASVIFPLTAVIFAVIVFRFCLKKGHCWKIHESMPPVAERLVHASGDLVLPHVCKTVWIVWQADMEEHRNELHSENVRHLAAFLANHGGLHIILDQYEVMSAPSFSSWLREKQKCAEVVLFICPHVVPLPVKGSPVSLCGNFMAVFNMYKRALLDEQATVRFATVLLPYSDMEICKETKFLLEITPVFRLMDEVENLYFFIQNRVKFGPFGRRIIKFINKREYHETPEGQKLKEGMEEILKTTGQKTASGKACMSKDEVLKTGENLRSTINLKQRHLEVVGPPEPVQDCFVKETTRKFKPHPPPPILSEDDVDQSVFLINTQGLLSQQPIDSEPINPIIINSHCPLLSNNSDFPEWFHPNFYNNV